MIELCHEDVSQVIAKCLDEFSSSNNVIYFKELELDLGTIDFSDLSWELPERVAETLRKKLTEIFLNARQEEVEIKSTMESCIESIDYFLQHGFLPWNTRESDVVLLLQRSLQNKGSQLATLIRRTGSSATVRIRLTERFSPIMLQKIVRALEPQYGQLIIDYHGHLMLLNSKETIVKIPETSLEKTIWLFVFNHLLVEQGSVFNARSFTKSMLRQFSCHYNIAFSDLLFLVINGLRRWEGGIPPPFFSLLEEMGRELQEQNDKKNVSDDVAIDTSKIPAKLAVLLQHLDNADINTLPDSKRASPENILDSLAENLPKQLLSALVGLHSREEIVREIVLRGSANIPRKIIKAIEPGEFETVVNYHKNLVTLHSISPIVKTSHQELEHNLWIFMIVNLLDNHGSYFNQKSFLRSMISATAAHYGLKMEVLTHKLYLSASFLPSRVSRINSFFKIISDIQTEVSAGISPFKKASANNRKRESKIAALEKVILLWTYGFKVPTPQSEKSFISVLKSTPVSSANVLRKYLHHQNVMTQLSKFSGNGFSELIKRLSSPQVTSVLLQFILLTENIVKHMIPYFGSNASFRSAAKLTILEVLEIISRAGSNLNDNDLMKVILTRLATKGKSLRGEQLIGIASRYGNTFLAKKLNWEIKKQTTVVEEGNKVHEMIQWLLSVDGKRTEIIFEDYGSRREVVNFLCSYYATILMQSLYNLSDKKVHQFVKHLTYAELDIILRADRGSIQTEWGVLLYHELSQRLGGYYRQKDISIDIKRVILEGVIKRELPDSIIFINKLVLLLDSYKVPATFFEKSKQWTLPVMGDVADAIKEIEKRVSDSDGRLVDREGRNTKVLALKEIVAKAKSKVKLTDKDNSKVLDISAEVIYVSNAGLVLIHPYLSYLFEQCDLIQHGKFKTPEAAMRGVAMLHYAFSGSEAYKEEDYALNKILCGLRVDTVSKKVKLKKKEKEMVSSMLLALAGHWEIIKNSTEEDVRGNWLVREGKLIETKDYWELTIKRNAYDILLDSLPFTLSPVSNSWMNKMIIIHWL